MSQSPKAPAGVTPVPAGRAPDRVETLAREIYAQMLGSHLWASTTIHHRAAEAQDAAAAFYRVWDTKEPPSGENRRA